MSATLDVFDLWQSLMSEVNVQQGGNIRPQVDFENWLNDIINGYFHEKVGIAELNQQTDDTLRPFYKIANTPTIDVPGQPYNKILYPSDYEGFASCKIIRTKDDNQCFFDPQYPIIDGKGISEKYTDPDYAQMTQRAAGQSLITKVVQKISSQRWDSCMEHRTKGPSFSSPMCMQFDGGFKIAPKGIQGVILEYYRTPRQAKFAYTIGAGDIVVYDAANSIQPEFSNTLKAEFIARLVKKYGKYIQDQTIYQMGDNDKNQL